LCVFLVSSDISEWCNVLDIGAQNVQWSNKIFCLDVFLYFNLTLFIISLPIVFMYSNGQKYNPFLFVQPSNFFNGWFLLSAKILMYSLEQSSLFLTTSGYIPLTTSTAADDECALAPIIFLMHCTWTSSIFLASVSVTLAQTGMAYSKWGRTRDLNRF